MPEYDYAQMGSYFVTLCTFHRVHIFRMELPQEDGSGHADRGLSNRILHKWIREIQHKYPNVTVERYVIMPDHVHLIVTIKEGKCGTSLPAVMRYFKTMTTNEYIRNVKEGYLPPFEGKIWQKSYYDHVIRNQQDYQSVWEYIVSNPAKWMMIHENSGEE